MTALKRSQQTLMTASDFLLWADQREDGKIYERAWGSPVIKMMASAGRRHGLIRRNVLRALESQLAGKPCQPFIGEDLALRTSEDADGSDWEPDILVDCGTPAPGENPRRAIEPALVVEILSKNKTIDEGKKLPDYERDKWMRCIIYIEQKYPWIMVKRRDSMNDPWRTEIVRNLDQNIDIPILEVLLQTKSIYESVAFDADQTTIETLS